MIVRVRVCARSRIDELLRRHAVRKVPVRARGGIVARITIMQRPIFSPHRTVRVWARSACEVRFSVRDCNGEGKDPEVGGREQETEIEMEARIHGGKERKTGHGQKRAKDAHTHTHTHIIFLES